MASLQSSSSSSSSMPSASSQHFTSPQWHAHSPSFSVFTGSTRTSFSSLSASGVGSSYSSSSHSWTMDVQTLDSNESEVGSTSLLSAPTPIKPLKLLQTNPSPLSSASSLSSSSSSPPSRLSRCFSLLFPLNRFRLSVLSSFYGLAAFSSFVALFFLFSRSLVYYDEFLFSFSFQPWTFFSHILVWNLIFTALFFSFQFMFASAVNHNSSSAPLSSLPSPVSSTSTVSGRQLLLDRFFSLSFCVSTFNFFFFFLFLLPSHFSHIRLSFELHSCGSASPSTVSSLPSSPAPVFCISLDDFLWLLLLNTAPAFFHLVEIMSAPAHRLAFAARGRTAELLTLELWVSLFGFIIFEDVQHFSLANSFAFFVKNVPATAVIAGNGHAMSVLSLVCLQIFLMILAALVYFFCGCITGYLWNSHQFHSLQLNAGHKNSSFRDLFRFSDSNKTNNNRENISSGSRRRITNQTHHQHSRSASFSSTASNLASGQSTPPMSAADHSDDPLQQHVAEYEIAIFSPGSFLAPLAPHATNGEAPTNHADSQSTTERAEHSNATHNSVASPLDDWLLIDSETTKRPATSNARNRFTDAPIYPTPAVASSAWM